MKKIFLVVLSIIMCAITLVSALAHNKTFAQESNMFDDFSSTSYILMDADSNLVLYGMNVNQKMQVASICKLMTTLITLENIDNGTLSLDDELVASEHACEVEGSQAFLDPGAKYKVSDLLKSVIIASANDSAIVLAESIGGSENNFARLMNKRAKELGMTSTVYANATGLNASNQYSTAYDTTTVLRAVEKFPLYHDYCKIWMDKLVHSTGRVTELVNTNRLIRYYDNCTGGKTGYTDEAGYCLSSTASKDDMNLVAVVLNCKDSASRFKESMQLYNYAFANYTKKQIVDSSKPLDVKIQVLGGKQKQVALYAEYDYSIVDKKYENGDITIAYDIQPNIKAPCADRTVVGKLIISKNGVAIGSVNIVLGQSVEKQTYFGVVKDVASRWPL